MRRVIWPVRDWWLSLAVALAWGSAGSVAQPIQGQFDHHDIFVNLFGCGWENVTNGLDGVVTQAVSVVDIPLPEGLYPNLAGLPSLRFSLGFPSVTPGLEEAGPDYFQLEDVLSVAVEAQGAWQIRCGQSNYCSYPPVFESRNAAVLSTATFDLFGTHNQPGCPNPGPLTTNCTIGPPLAVGAQPFTLQCQSTDASGFNLTNGCNAVLNRLGPDSGLGLIQYSMFTYLYDSTDPLGPQDAWMEVEVLINSHYRFDVGPWQPPPADDYLALDASTIEPPSGSVLTTGMSPIFAANASCRLEAHNAAWLQLQLVDAGGILRFTSPPVAVTNQPAIQTFSLAITNALIAASDTNLFLEAVLLDPDTRLPFKSAVQFGWYTAYTPTDVLQVSSVLPPPGRTLSPSAPTQFAASMTCSLQTRPQANLVLRLLNSTNNVLASSAPLRVSQSRDTSTIALQTPPCVLFKEMGQDVHLEAAFLDAGTGAPWLRTAPATYPVPAAGLWIMVTNVIGEGELLVQGHENTPIPLSGGEFVKPSDRIYTGIDSSVTLLFSDNSTVVIRELTDVQVGAFTSGADGVRTRLWLKAGEVNAKLNHGGAVRSDFQIKTPTATCSVRGTEFTVEYDASPEPQSIVTAIVDTVEVTPENPALPRFVPALWKPTTVTLNAITGAAFTNVPAPQMPGYNLRRFARIDDPVGLAMGGDGILRALEDASGSLDSIGPDGAVNQWASLWSDPDALRGPAVDQAGNVYVSHTTGCAVFKVTPDGAVTHFAAGLLDPVGLVAEPSNNVFVASQSAGMIYRVNAAGAAVSYAIVPSRPDSPALDAAGNLYVLSCQFPGFLVQVQADGSSTDLAQMPFQFSPASLAWDPVSDSFVIGEDAGDASGTARLLRVERNGTVTTIGTGFSRLRGLAFDTAGVLYLADYAEGIVYRAALLGSGPPHLEMAATNVDFGDAVAWNAALESVRVFNTGDDTLHLTAATCTNGLFRLAAPALPVAVPADAYIDLDIQFQPTGLGAQSAVLRLASDDPSRPDTVLLLSGTGVGLSAPTPVPEGLICWWTLDGNAREFVTGADSPVGGAVAYTNGLVGQCLYFDGATTTLQAPAAVLTNLAALSNAFTFEAWLRFDDTTNRPILEYDASSPHAMPTLELWAERHYGDPATAPGDLSMSIWGPPGQYDLPTAVHALAAGTFHHLAAILDSTNTMLQLWVDGQEVYWETGDYFAAGTPAALLIGNGSAAGRLGVCSFKGCIDEPAFYNRALSPDEVRALYLAGAQGKERHPCLAAQAISPESLLLTWANPYSAFHLESADGLAAPGSWVPVAASPTHDTGGWHVVVQSSGPGRFYRLVQNP
jgi:sugar lactone lactonase YvrE